jgi:hypothetical protein
MHPLVVQALLTAFQRSLKEELGGWLTGPSGSTRPSGSTGPSESGASAAG